MTDINSLITTYYDWLKDKTAWKKFNQWSEITVPYLDRNNDYIQIYLKQEGDEYTLTDEGSIISGLLAEGCKLTSPKRKKLLKLALVGYGVEEKDGILMVKATPDNFALRKHSLVQAMLAVNDMFYLAEPHVKSLFFEDVQSWLDLSDIRYSENISFVGRSGYNRKFDFLISKSRNAPERVMKAINHPVKNSADSIIMDWIDIKEIRAENSQAYSIINDIDKQALGVVLEALKSYGIKPILWSERYQFVQELAA